MLQALKEDPPLNTKCKDKFLIQSTIITPEKEALPVQAIWSSPDANEEGKVHQQKLRVTYLPAEGQTLEEEDENSVAMASMTIGNNSNDYDTVRQHPGTESHPPNLLFELAPAPSQQPEERSSTPTQDAVERRLSSHTVVQDIPQVQYRPPSPTPLPAHTEPATSQPIYVDSMDTMTMTEPIPEPSRVQDSEPEPAPAPQPVVPAPITAAPITSTPEPPAPIIIENPVNEELYAKYNHAQVEIERLRAQITSLSELRRRPRAPSDAGSSVAASDVQTTVEESPIQPEGVPLQVVVIIAFGVFITTYLFF